MRSKNIFIAGAGGIGRAVALMLTDHYQDELGITIGDVNFEAAEHALDGVALFLGGLK